MAAFSTRGLPQLTKLFARSRHFNRQNVQTINLTYCRVVSLHNFKRNCSTIPKDQGELFDELKEDADNSSSYSENEDQKPAFHDISVEGSFSEQQPLSHTSNIRRSFQKKDSVSSSEKEVETSPENLTEDDGGLHKVLRGIGPTSEVQNKRKLLVPDQPENAKIIRISIIGAPNAGKSTLTNSLMNWKVSSVSNKVHTTRKNTLAVLTEDETQIIFLDTPGVLDPEKRKRHNLDANMVTDPAESVSKADMIGVLVDVADTWTRTELNKNILKILHLNKHIPSILILNKVDIVKQKSILLKICQKLLNGRCGGKPLAVNSEDDKTNKATDLEKVLSEYHTRQRNKAFAEDDDGYDRQGCFDDDDDDGYGRRGRYDDDDDGYGRRGRYDDDDGYDRRGGYNYDDSIHIPEKQIQSFLAQTKEKIVDYRQNKDEKRMLKSNSVHVLDDVRYRLSLLSLDINPALNTVTQKLVEENEIDEKKLNRELENQSGWSHFSNVFMVSAKRDDGVKELKEYLKDMATPGDWQYHSSLVTDKSPQDVAISLVQEQILEHLALDIPYKIVPKIQEWNLTQRDLFVVMRLEAKHDRDMKYLIGRGGSTIKSISSGAIQELQNALRCEVRLLLKCALCK